MSDTEDDRLPDAPHQAPAVPPELEVSAGGNRIPTEAELDKKYPNRPKNERPTLPFHELYQRLFDPLLENQKIKGSRRASSKLRPHEVRRNIIDQFIARWRTHVGNDIFPAFRLILPDRDRDRNVYHLKEQKIGKLLVKAMKINRDSEDGRALIYWRQPGASIRSAGDFALRCHEIIKKRPMRTEPGNLTIGEVNDMLDRLSLLTAEDKQLPIIMEFYSKMNADELLWLIRIIMKQMKIGATENTFFHAWHPDADALFSVSSSLRRVCWELWDPNFRLEDETKGVTLMSCFQPQLAQFQKKSLENVVKLMGNEEFWIEEKLDGERIQLHYDNGKFRFWSRKAKEYSYLYGEDFGWGGLCPFLKDAFNERVQSIILDGEMIEWDPHVDCDVSFGTLKTAALATRDNPHHDGNRPLYRVFDILYLNGQCLIGYSLSDRRKALEASVRSVHRRIEILDKKSATTPAEIEAAMRDIIAKSSEGLVIKNPRSVYRLNDRNDDWVKVKPEYMTEYGESLDCLIIGAYWGSGRRGNIRSSYLCGLRVDGVHKKPGDPDNRFWSFFKVGGGITANEYARIAHRTEGKWVQWDRANPPTEFIELAGGDKQYECPDEWIHPEDSFVVEVKAASVASTDQFRIQRTLRFPRFKRFREDKNWRSALSVTEFEQLRKDIDRTLIEKRMDIEEGRKGAKRRKKEYTVLNGEEVKFEAPPAEQAPPGKPLFEGRSFFVMSEATTGKVKKTKPEIEALIKAHGGKIFQNETADPDMIVIGDKNNVKVSALKKKGTHDIIRPSWIVDCITQHTADGQAYLLPLEESYLLFATEDTAKAVAGNVDPAGDSYARNIEVAELAELLKKMPVEDHNSVEAIAFRDSEALAEGRLDTLPGWMFKSARVYVDSPSLGDVRARMHKCVLEFAGGHIVDKLAQEEKITHVLVDKPSNSRLLEIREALSRWNGRIPRVVTGAWLEESIQNRTLLDEERFAPALEGAA